MPELPEVETVRRTLKPAIGATITGISTSGKALRLGSIVPKQQLAAMIGGHIDGVRRHGKYLLVDVSTGASVLVHLGMSGRLRLHKAGEPAALHTHVTWQLSGGRELRFSDPRRFGQVDVVARGDAYAHPALAILGPDPIEAPASWTGAELYASARRTRVTVKALILDQRVVAGVGNIYASEALWATGLRPTVRADKLTRARAAQLAQAVKDVMLHALEHGGTSLRDYVQADGNAGEHADYLHVYGRDGEACTRCGTTIKRSVMQGRATFCCPACQQLR